MSDTFGSRQNNKRRILKTLESGDFSQSNLQEALHLGAGTVSRWIAALTNEKLIHIHKFVQHPHGGPQTAIYRIGKRQRDTPKPRVRSDAQRSRAYRQRMRSSGDWEDTLAKRRATYRINNPIRDPLAVALFGAVK